MKVVVCGGRDNTNFIAVTAGLNHFNAEREITMLIHGSARGVDTIAERWAKLKSIVYIGVPAQWRQYGNAAGPIRNALMLELFKPECVIAFPGGRGTEDMKAKARAAGVEVVCYPREAHTA